MKIVAPEHISALCDQLRTAGNTIVFTHGLFDLLLPDLIDSLTEARNRGTHLIVALYSDEAAAKLFGPQRPLVPLAERSEVLAALEMITYVTWFDGDTPEYLIALMKPDVILKNPENPAAFASIVERIVKLPHHSS